MSRWSLGCGSGREPVCWPELDDLALTGASGADRLVLLPESSQLVTSRLEADPAPAVPAPYAGARDAYVQRRRTP